MISQIDVTIQLMRKNKVHIPCKSTAQMAKTQELFNGLDVVPFTPCVEYPHHVILSEETYKEIEDYLLDSESVLVYWVHLWELSELQYFLERLYGSNLLAVDNKCVVDFWSVL